MHHQVKDHQQHKSDHCQNRKQVIPHKISKSVSGIFCDIVGQCRVDGRVRDPDNCFCHDGIKLRISLTDTDTEIRNEKALYIIRKEFEYSGLEFNNMKVTMDARPEIWQPRISGVDQDLYYNYIDAVFDEDENAYVKYFEDIMN